MSIKQKHLDLASFLQLLETTNGRDKASKLLQYGSKLWAAYLVSVGSRKELIAQFQKLDRATASARKLFRLAKWIPFLLKARDALLRGQLSIGEILNLGQALGMAVYFFFDNIGASQQ